MRSNKGSKLLCVKTWEAGSRTITAGNIYTVKSMRSDGAMVMLYEVSDWYDYPDHRGSEQFRLLVFKQYIKKL